MQAPIPFGPPEFDAALRAFGIDVSAAARAALFGAYQLGMGEWRIVARAAAAPMQHVSAPASFRTLACTWCRNADAHAFVHLYCDGDIVCLCCGRVAVSNALYEGEAERAFLDDDAPPRTHASFPDNRSFLFSDEHALRTLRVSVAAPDRDAAAASAAAYTSDAALQRGVTTTWCKDKDKQQCIALMEEAAVKLHVCRAARETAIALFARVRDAKQRIIHKRITMAACLLAAHAAAQWDRPFSKAPATTDELRFSCADCATRFRTPCARAQHACPTKRAVRKRKVHELDMLSFF